MTDVMNAAPDLAWGNPSAVRLYDGNPFLQIAVDVVSGFVIIELANRASSTLASVSCTITPVKGDTRLLTRWAPVTIQPSSRAMVPVAHTCGGTCECQVLVTFTRDVKGSAGSRVHACQARAMLLPAKIDFLHSVGAWRPLMPRLTRKEFNAGATAEGVPKDIASQPATMERLGHHLGGKMFPLEGAFDTDSVAWACLDPIMLAVSSGPTSSCTLYGADLAQLDAAAGASEMSSAKAREATLFELGIAITTLRDGLVLGTKADHVRPVGYRVSRMVETLQLRVPSMGQLLGILEHRESLGDLLASERTAYEQALVEVERQVLGHPS